MSQSIVRSRMFFCECAGLRRSRIGMGRAILRFDVLFARTGVGGTLFSEAEADPYTIVRNEGGMNLKDYIRSVPDFPKPGIMFRDITPLLKSSDAMKEVIQRLAGPFRDAGITSILAAEARGFVFGAPLAMELGAAFVPIRKPGKLPWETHKFSYDLEYGSDSLEIHRDAIGAGDRVLLVDDLLATGGTIEACMKLAQQQKADVVGAAFVIELAFLNGRRRLESLHVNSLITYQTEDAHE
jgi:adenine phosphoribosyltransferase